ncbi:MAG: hypothetical protein R6U95_01175 [Bacteroidales bacterium]
MNITESKFIDLKIIDGIENLTNCNWIGIAIPDKLDIKVQIKCSFKVIDNRLVGYMDVNDEGEVLRIDLEGGIIKPPFIIFDYCSTNPEIVNYGRIMYKINEKWNKLEGKVVGYSGERDFFVNATHDLKKIL